jgi:hypothetical protein
MQGLSNLNSSANLNYSRFYNLFSLEIIRHRPFATVSLGLLIYIWNIKDIYAILPYYGKNKVNKQLYGNNADKIGSKND